MCVLRWLLLGVSNCFFIFASLNTNSLTYFWEEKKKHDISSSGPNFHCFCFTLLRSCFIFPEKYTSCIAWFHIFCFAFVSLSTTHVPKRQKLYVLHMMASVPYKLLFVYDTVCIGFSGITSASGRTWVGVTVRVVLCITTTTRITFPTHTRRKDLINAGFLGEQALKLQVPK